MSLESFFDDNGRRIFAKLFRRSTAKVFVVGLCVFTSVVNDTISMIWWRVKSIEIHWNQAGINDVVVRSSWNDDREAACNRGPNTLKHRFTCPFLNTKKLVELMDFLPDLFGRE